MVLVIQLLAANTLNCIIRVLRQRVTIDSLGMGNHGSAVLPAPGYAVIDTVNNNPATGYWAPPGNGGVTAASVENPTVIDLVSMSRVTDGTDGTAAAKLGSVHASKC